MINTLRTTIKIANPVEGGKTHTSAKRALHFIRRREATLTNEGALYFFTSAQVLANREQEREAALLDRHRKGIVYWNGSGDPLAMRRPGEARS